MPKVLHIAWREFKHTALTRAFILGAVMVPLVLFGAIVLMPLLMKPTLPPIKGTLALVRAPDTDIAEAIAAELTPQRVAERSQKQQEKMARGAMSVGRVEPGEAMQMSAVATRQPRVEVELAEFELEADLDQLKERVRNGDFLALVVVPDAVLEPSPGSQQNNFDLFVRSGAPPNQTRLFEEAISDALVSTRVKRSGVELEHARALVRSPTADTKRLTDDGRELAENPFAKAIIPMAFMMLVWIATFTSGNYLLTSTIEEKSNKVMEVLLSAISPMQLMTGKILGQAMVSLLMLVLYAGLGITVLAAMAMGDLIPAIHLLYLALYFIMAYFMIAAIMASVGSAVNELRDAQSLITPAMLVLMIPLILWLPISENPNGWLATITSFIPPLIPFVMILRVTAANEPVATWQIIATLVVGYAATVGMVWMCAKIFRIGVLMYGKPPSPIELLRWLRYR